MEPGPSAAHAIRQHLDEQVVRLLPALCLVLSFLYGAYFLLQTYVAQVQDLRPIQTSWLLTTFAFLTAGLVQLRWRVPAWAAHPILVATALLILSNSVQVLYHGGPLFSNVLILVMVAYATLAMSLPWFLVILTTAIGGWVTVAVIAPPDPMWAPASAMIASSAAVAVFTQILRVRAMRQVVALQEEQLEAQRVTHERAQRVLRADLINAAAHEVATPLTPIVLQLHQLRDPKQMTPEQLAKVDMISRNLERLRSGIDNIQKLAMTGPAPKESA